MIVRNDGKRCPICSTLMRPQSKRVLLGSYDVTYYFCDGCELIQTESPYWLEQAYSSAIAKTDTGILSRNLSNRDLLEPLLYVLFEAQGTYVDLGGGYGLLTRLLRDAGIECFSTDLYCENLFAADFEPAEGLRPNALFAFEVMEHIEQPLQFVAESFEKYHCSTLIFSTLDYGDTVPPDAWWYYALETGQHISFYNQKTLNTLAESVSCRYLRISDSYHLLTNLELSKRALSLVTNKRKLRKLRKAISKKLKNRSLTASDYEKAKSALKSRYGRAGVKSSQ